MSRLIDLSGKQFRRLTVIARAGTAAGRKTMWVCQCSCGKSTLVQGGNLRSDHTKSCGCILKNSQHSKTHGQSRTTTFGIYHNMKRRCYNKSNHAYPRYGGRGILVCERWHTFENFFADMGERPAGKSLDRIDNGGNYEPTNCRWVDSITQNNNRRDNRLFEFNGEAMSAPAWSRKTGIPLGTIWTRIKLGWPIDKALTTKPRGLS